jgi:hypothetical protein
MHDLRCQLGSEDINIKFQHSLTVQKNMNILQFISILIKLPSTSVAARACDITFHQKMLNETAKVPAGMQAERRPVQYANATPSFLPQAAQEAP